MSLDSYIPHTDVDLKRLRADIALCWTPQTSNVNGAGSRGQCFVTALLIQDILGGNILVGKIDYEGREEDHYWNKLSDGVIIDFTGDQYGGDGFEPVIPDGTVESKPNRKNKRYVMLRTHYLTLKKNGQATF